MPSRWGASTALLRDGRVLVIGGANPHGGAVDLAAKPAILNPATIEWQRLDHPTKPRRWPTLVVLEDGRVMVLAGDGRGACGGAVELLDPENRTWSPGPPLPGFTTPGWPAARRLGDGTVLALGTALGEPGAELGVVGRAARFHPGPDEWTVVAAPPGIHPATCVSSDGRFFVSGGSRNPRVVGSSGEVDPEELTDTSVFEPERNGWRPSGHMSTTRGAHACVALVGGEVMIIGGDVIGGGSLRALSQVEIVHLESRWWRRVASLHEARSMPSAVTLGDGRVLVVGGRAHAREVQTAEIYDPARDCWEAAAPPEHPRRCEPLLLADGRVLYFGGARATAGEIFDPSTGGWTRVTEPG